MAWQIIGHKWAVTLLRQSLAAGRVSHAYLFSGPPQVGKTRLALALAQALNCSEAEPGCGRCPSCLKIMRGTHPDVRLIVGEGAGGSLKIDQVRALQREAVLSPYEGRYRVFILRRMDLASIEAANSLLKTLEEPPDHVVLILTAVQSELLPTTVTSRCQHLNLRPVPQRIVADELHERGVPAEQAQLLARLCGGRVGWALHASADQGVLRQRQQDLDRLAELLSADRVERLDFAWKASRDLPASVALLDLWATWWHDLLLSCGQNERDVTNVDRSAEIEWFARQGSLAQAWAALNMLQTTAGQLEANVNPRLAWEGLLLGLPRWQPLPERQPAGQES